MSEEMIELDVKDAALELFIDERMKVATEWGISTTAPISKRTLDGIDAEANERIRIKLLAALRESREKDAQLAAKDARIAELESQLKEMIEDRRAISEVLKEKPEHPHEAGYIFGYYADHKVNSRDARIRAIVEGK